MVSRIVSDADAIQAAVSTRMGDLFQESITLIGLVVYVFISNTELALLSFVVAPALVFPVDGSDEADMHSILTIMAIKAVAPTVRTVAEVNNPRHEPHFHRADVDELLVTSKVASHLLARSALYPGLTGLVTDIVSGGEGSELYRVTLPDAYLGLSIDTVSARLRDEHEATLLSVNRGGRAFVNPRSDFVLEPGDDAIVIAESLGTLAPLKLHDLHTIPQTAAVVPSA